MVVGAVVAGGAVFGPVVPAVATGGSSLVDETFTGTSVADPRFVPLGDACLTAAGRPSTPPSGASTLSGCTETNGSPGVGTPGWLQLTDDSNNRTGGVIFDQALPDAAGLDVTFDQAQYGGTSPTGADGIGFFLSDGSYDLTTTGAPGGALGYTNRIIGSTEEEGVVGGFLGVGLDAYGNFAPDTEGKGAGCTPSSPISGLDPNAVTLRGPGSENSSGQWLEGYCNLSTEHLTGSQDLRTDVNDPLNVELTVSPRATDGSVTVSVAIRFPGATTSTPILGPVTVPNAPRTIKFGFSGSTGGSSDVHLIRNVVVNTIDPLGELNLVKQVDESSPYARTIYQAGDTIPYSFVVTNSGTSGITGVAVTDPYVAGTVQCPENTLAAAGQPGSNMTCAGSHLVTPGEVAASSQFQNTATVSGTAAGTTVTATDSTTVQLGTASMTLQKASDVSTVAQLGQVVHYTFTVKNTGSIPLAPVTVSDPSSGLSAAPCVASLAAGATATCSTVATHTITEADLLAGVQYLNTATATGTLPSTVTGGSVDATASAAVTTVSPRAALTLSKTPSARSEVELGHVIDYSFSVTNTGNVSLAPVVVSDAQLGISSAPCVSSLAPGATSICSTTGSHTVTDADVALGKYQNSATATGTPPSGSGLAPVTADASATVTTSGETAEGELPEMGSDPSQAFWLATGLIALGILLLGCSRRRQAR